MINSRGFVINLKARRGTIMRKNMDHLKDQDIDQSDVEKNEAHKAHDYERKCMESTHNKISRGAEYICKCMTSPHKDNWRRGHGKPGDGNLGKPAHRGDLGKKK